ncbi:MAG: class I SAM-dependent methyltransferase [Pseudomonadota bacterium]|nr:class I SAM-dependent methyltransferase [Pseudomonadota bacterium]
MSFSPAAERNQAPILAALQQLLPAQARVLEIASGSGQHAAHFAAAQPGWTWQPTEYDAAALPSITARVAAFSNVRRPVQLDVLTPQWPLAPEHYDALYCANMLHIAAWPTCAALMRGAAAHLLPGGLLVLYGPYLVDGEPLAPSNAAFDADLRRRDPRWGLRRLGRVLEAARGVGLTLERRFDLAANNLLLAIRKASAR